MLLAIDVGNTNIVFGIYNEDNIIATFRLNTKKYSLDEMGILINQHFLKFNINTNAIVAAVIASVVPNITRLLNKAIKKYLFLNSFIIGKNLMINIKNMYYNPEQAGIDRLVNAVIAIKKFGSPCIIVDMGTATTIDAINLNGEFMGGAIFPGLGILSEALSKKTALLPQIEFSKATKVIGQNTKECINSGIYYGYKGAIKKILKEIKKDLGTAKVIATGGLSKLFINDNLFDLIDENLTLDGIKLIYDNYVKENKA